MKAHSILLTAAFSERMCQVASTIRCFLFLFHSSVPFFFYASYTLVSGRNVVVLDGVVSPRGAALVEQTGCVVGPLSLTGQRRRTAVQWERSDNPVGDDPHDAWHLLARKHQAQ